MFPHLRLKTALAALMTAVILSGCGAFPARDSGPASAMDTSRIPDPVPRAEPRSPYGNKPYTVFGVAYDVLDASTGYVERGVASWYGRKFHGQFTSSREVYDMYAMTAAHRTLPLPTYVQVTNLQNGRSCIVRVNDRGPFVGDRLIDLSYAAASKLGIVEAGTATVEVRAIDTAPKEETAEPFVVTPQPAFGADTPVAEAFGTSVDPLPRKGARRESLYVQIGAFSSRENAERLRNRLLQEQGIRSAIFVSDQGGGRIFHQLRVGPITSNLEAERLVARIQGLGAGTPRIVREEPVAGLATR